MCVKIWLRAGLVRTNLKLEWSGVEWIGHELEWIGVEWSDPLHSNPLQLMPNPLNPTALLSLKCVADLLQASSTTSLAPLTASSLQHHLQHAYIYIYIYTYVKIDLGVLSSERNALQSNQPLKLTCQN